MMNRWTMVAACASAVMALSACSSVATNSSNAPTNSTSGVSSNHTAAPVMYEFLQAYHWDLDSAQDAAGRAAPQFKAQEPKHRVRLNFMEGSQAGEHTISTKVCNQMLGGYTLQGNQIQTGRWISTMMACMDPGLTQLERAVGGQLEGLQSVQQLQGGSAPKILLGFKDGSRWEMSGKPTDATRFGGAGETIFLEVAPQTKPCTSGVARTQCLQVREVRYDQSSRKSYASDWQNFYQPIEGFTHEAGMRNVLRVKRYNVANPPADGSRFAYVLDMRVETEIVKP